MYHRRLYLIGRFRYSLWLNLLRIVFLMLFTSLSHNAYYVNGDYDIFEDPKKITVNKP